MGRAVRDLMPTVTRLSPRHALNCAEAALFIGISETMFRELVEDGTMPRPREIGARVLWDVDELTLAFKAIPRQGDKPKVRELKGWDDVVGR